MLLRCRLIAEKINKNERKGEYELMNVSMGQEDDDFWSFLNGQPAAKLIVRLGRRSPLHSRSLRSRTVPALL